MGMNYVKVFADNTEQVTVDKPVFGLGNTRSKADYNPDVQVKGLWYNSTNGDEKVIDGEFNIGVSEWTSQNSAVLTLENGMMKITSNGTLYGRAYKGFSTIIGKTYKLKFNLLAGTSATRYLSISSTLTSTLGSEDMLYAPNPSFSEYEFTAISSTTYIYFSNQVTGYNYVDSISLFEAEIEPDTVYPTQFTYLSQNGKLLGVEAQNGVPVEQHFTEDAPDIVEDCIQGNKLIAIGDIDVGGQVNGKNQCTAWVNFDGSTTPPTIRDSFNVKDIVRVSTGIFDVYFETPMDNINYSTTGSARNMTVANNEGVSIKTIYKETIDIYSTATVLSNPVGVYLQTFGGKN